MDDRDTFAAAALTRGMGVLGYEQIAKSCYEMADAMLRERAKTNHDALPGARAEDVLKEPTGRSGGAYDRSECGCPGVDWTPQEVYDLRSAVARLQLTDDELAAIKYFSGFQWTLCKGHSKTLQKLLERLQ